MLLLLQVKFDVARCEVVVVSLENKCGGGCDDS